MDNDKREAFAAPGNVFFIVGIAFFVLGISGKTAFLGLGAAFFVIGLSFIAQAKKDKDGGNKGDTDKNKEDTP